MEGEMQQDVLGSDGIAVRYGLEGLRQDWRRCSLSSDFLASASCEPRFAQRVISGAVNELLELVFKLGAEGGAAALNVSTHGELAIIALQLPLPQAALEQVLARIAEIRCTGAQQVYLQQLGADSEPEPLFGLLQLMVDFGATLSAEGCGDGLHLRLELDTTGGSN